MALAIGSNIANLQALNNLNKGQMALSTALPRLGAGQASSGAGTRVDISAKLMEQTSKLDSSARETNDGISLIQTADGALGQVGDMLNQMRNLAMQSADSSSTEEDKKTLQAQQMALGAEIQRVAQGTEFNGQKLLDGSFQGKQISLRANGEQSVSIGALGNVAELTGVQNGNLQSVDAIDKAIQTVSSMRSGLLESQSKISDTFSTLQPASLQSTTDASRRIEASTAQDPFERSQMLRQASQAMLAQANALPQQVLALLR